LVAHEIAGVAVATIIGLVFVSALKPNSSMASILNSVTGGWATILNSVGGTPQTQG
jgi:hypothetical protein